MDFNKITNAELDAIDLSSLSECINSSEYAGYFKGVSSSEHYRLLSHISLNNNNINILDIGTLKGCSALAFSINKSNTVYSFNLNNELDLNCVPENINFIIDDVANGNYKDLILKSPYILLDTFHDGTFEHRFCNYLKDIGYIGYLLLDDIKLNKEMDDFWNSIENKKIDISNIGHWSGTGVVLFNIETV